jgi:DNA-binding CsgD family transcriptional regulator/PAS domain-containing protein
MLQKLFDSRSPSRATVETEEVLQALYGAAIKEATFQSVLAVVRSALKAARCSVTAVCPRTFSLLGSVGDAQAMQCITCMMQARAAAPSLVLPAAECVVLCPCPKSDSNTGKSVVTSIREPGHCLVALLDQDRNAITCVSFERDVRDPPFDPADKQTLNRFVSHLQKARQEQETVQAQQQLTATLRRTLAGLLELLPMAAALLNHDGAIILANKDAEHLVASGNGISTGPGGLRVRQLGRSLMVADILRTRLAAGGDPHEGEIVVVQRSCDDRPLHAAILPWGEPEASGPSRPAALILFHDPERPVELDAIALRKMFGFTEAEIRVATLLVNGRCADELACELGISPHTARTHLKRILAKVGAIRQIELIRILLCCFQRLEGRSGKGSTTR